jgi:hypothetical protein
MMDIYVKLDLDEHGLNLVIGCNTRRTISNPKTQIGIMTHQRVQKVVELIWHDVDSE